MPSSSDHVHFVVDDILIWLVFDSMKYPAVTLARFAQFHCVSLCNICTVPVPNTDELKYAIKVFAHCNVLISLSFVQNGRVV